MARKGRVESDSLPSRSLLMKTRIAAVCAVLLVVGQVRAESPLSPFPEIAAPLTVDSVPLGDSTTAPEITLDFPIAAVGIDREELPRPPRVAA
jgi:hypothetical protein